MHTCTLHTPHPCGQTPVKTFFLRQNSVYNLRITTVLPPEASNTKINLATAKSTCPDHQLILGKQIDYKV